MGKRIAAGIAVTALLGGGAVAQSRVTDFSGRWVLTSWRPAGTDIPDTLEISAADELLIRQTLHAITVEHPSGSGKHPEAGTFEFGLGGTSLRGSWGVTFFGTQLMFSRSTIGLPDAPHARVTTAQGSMWRLDQEGRLTIEFREERRGERPRTATRMYVRR